MSLRQSLTSRGARAAAVGCFSAALAALGSLASLAVRDAWAVPLLLVVALSCAMLFAAAIAGFRDKLRGTGEENAQPQPALPYTRKSSPLANKSAPLRIRAPSPPPTPPTMLRKRRTSALPLARRLLLARSQQMDDDEGAVEGFINLSPRATDARANIAPPSVSRSPTHSAGRALIAVSADAAAGSARICGRGSARLDC